MINDGVGAKQCFAPTNIPNARPIIKSAKHILARNKNKPKIWACFYYCIFLLLAQVKTRFGEIMPERILNLYPAGGVILDLRVERHLNPQKTLHISGH